MQQLGNDSTVEIIGTSAPTGPVGPSISTGNADRWVLHYLALETLKNLSTLLSKSC
jgi:hypothetical protein